MLECTLRLNLSWPRVWPSWKSPMNILTSLLQSKSLELVNEQESWPGVTVLSVTAADRKQLPWALRRNGLVDRVNLTCPVLLVLPGENKCNLTQKLSCLITLYHLCPFMRPQTGSWWKKKLNYLIANYVLISPHLWSWGSSNARWASQAPYSSWALVALTDHIGNTVRVRPLWLYLRYTGQHLVKF